MAYYNKVGLLALSDNKKKFLVCWPGPNYGSPTKAYLMPGGQIEAGESDIDCLKREVMEELAVELDPNNIDYINEYIDKTVFYPDRDVSIKLYAAKMLGEPKASDEIGDLAWIGLADANDEKVSPIIKNKIIPDLVKRGLLT
jgi:8-oxo-dGTP diphosphatase